MSECFRYLFLHNENLKPTEDFKDSYLLKGTSLYEVVRIISGQAIFLPDHYKRLTNSAKKMNLAIPYDYHEIKHFIQLLVEKNDCQIGNIKLVFNFEGKNENFYAYFVNHYYPSELQYQNGVRTLLHQAERPIPTAKVYNHQLRTKTNDIIREADIFEVILLNSLGNITEGSRSNLFFLKAGALYTAPDDEVLNGIARSKVIKIAGKIGVTVYQKCITYEELPQYEAAFLTGTSPMVLPIRRINSLSYSVTHPLLKNILKEYHLMVQYQLDTNE